MVLFGIPQEVSTLRVMHFLKNQKKDRSNLPGGHTLVSSRYCPGIHVLCFRKVWKLELFFGILRCMRCEMKNVLRLTLSV